MLCFKRKSANEIFCSGGQKWEAAGAQQIGGEVLIRHQTKVGWHI